MMIEKECPSCHTKQLYDELYGYVNPKCPDFCVLMPFPSDMYDDEEE